MSGHLIHHPNRKASQSLTHSITVNAKLIPKHVRIQQLSSAIQPKITWAAFTTFGPGKHAFDISQSLQFFLPLSMYRQQSDNAPGNAKPVPNDPPIFVCLTLGNCYPHPNVDGPYIECLGYNTQVFLKLKAPKGPLKDLKMPTAAYHRASGYLSSFFSAHPVAVKPYEHLSGVDIGHWTSNMAGGFKINCTWIQQKKCLKAITH